MEALMSGDISDQAVSGVAISWGDDYEMAEALRTSLVRTADRLIGFLAGVCLLAGAWAVWHLV
jgi:hypothetical protein